MLKPFAALLVLMLGATSAAAFDPGPRATTSGRALGAELVPAVARALAAYRAVRDATEELVADMGRCEVLILQRDKEQAPPAVTALQQRFAQALALLDTATAAQKALGEVATRVHERGWGLGQRVLTRSATRAEQEEADDLGQLDLALHEAPDYSEVAVGLDSLVFAYMDHSLHVINIVQRTRALLGGKLPPLGGPKTAAERDALLKKVLAPPPSPDE